MVSRVFRATAILLVDVASAFRRELSHDVAKTAVQLQGHAIIVVTQNVAKPSDNGPLPAENISSRRAVIDPFLKQDSATGQPIIQTLNTPTMAQSEGSNWQEVEKPESTLFHIEGRPGIFAEVERLMLRDETTALRRLLGFLSQEGAGGPKKQIMLGYGGSGKTETVNYATGAYKRLRFNLKEWYLEHFNDNTVPTRSEVYKQYNKGVAGEITIKGAGPGGEDMPISHKQHQIALLNEEEMEIMTEYQHLLSESSSAAATHEDTASSHPQEPVIAFIDEIDLVGKAVIEDNLRAMRKWLKIMSAAISGATSAGLATTPVLQIAVLHPGVSLDLRIYEVVTSEGFPERGWWIDFTSPYSMVIQQSIARAVLTEECSGQYAVPLANYLAGLPGANVPLLCNTMGATMEILTLARDKKCEEAFQLAKTTGKQGLFAQIRNDVQFDATRNVKRAIRFIYERTHIEVSSPLFSRAQAYCDFEGAVKIGSVLERVGAGGREYYMGDVYRDALEYAKTQGKASWLDEAEATFSKEYSGFQPELGGHSS